MEWYDALLVGTLVAVTLHHGAMYHAPNSRDVVNARFRSADGSCYRLQPLRVECSATW